MEVLTLPLDARVVPAENQALADAVRGLIHASGLHGHITFAHAVLEGRQPGAVIVDRRQEPRAAIVCNYSGFFLAFGEPDAGLAVSALAEIAGHPVDFQSRVIFGSSPAWADTLAAILPELTTGKRLGFTWQPRDGRPPADWRARIPPELELAPIDEHLAQGILDGTSTQDFGIDPWFIRIAGGPAAYAALGLGLALVERAPQAAPDGVVRQIASLCGVCALGGGEAEMEVGTTPAYRGRGLATLVSAAFLEQASRQGWRAAYTCDSENLPSISVAHKLGFVEVEEISGFILT